MIRRDRLAHILVSGLVIGLGIANLYWSVAQWSLSDAGAYWDAAHRLREGADLYPTVADVEASDVYRYAPWFAWLAVPFSFLPIGIAGFLWSAILVAASVVAVIPLARHGAWLQVAFFFPILIGISAVGNVHALMVAWLVWGVERRSGPLWIALAASLKAVPILLALVYLGRREWWRLAATLGLTTLLVMPALLYDLSGYVTSSGNAGGLVEAPLLFSIALMAAGTATVLLARGRLNWLAGATAVTLATPRFFVYDVTYLLVALTPQSLGGDEPRAGSTNGSETSDAPVASGDRRWRFAQESRSIASAHEARHRGEHGQTL